MPGRVYIAPRTTARRTSSRPREDLHHKLIKCSQPCSQFYCGVHDHWEAGMRAQITVAGDSAANEVTLAGEPVSAAWRAGGSSSGGFGPAATALLAAALAAYLLLLAV